MIPGKGGVVPLIYADYVASGRALVQIEEFIHDSVLPYYANSHTEASYCGKKMSIMRSEARQVLRDACGANENYSTIFTGSGATAGINKLVHLLGISTAKQAPLVIIGPYEHHSNILPWREAGAEVIEISEAPDGGPNLYELKNVLLGARHRKVIGSFSAASNVTGIVSDVKSVTKILKSHGAIVVWDYAGGAPYLPINLTEDEAEIDAIVMSPHKFLGGPGASGVLIVKNDVVVTKKPTSPGGGTVTFVSPWGHDYHDDLATREEAGTPNVIGDIRAALCVLVKSAIGQSYLDMRHDELRDKALKVWNENSNIEILGNPNAKSYLPIFSFRIKDEASDGYIHHQLFTRMLSDVYGIQVRGGCACAGPYAHQLMSINKLDSETMRAAIKSGREMEKPGWVRLNFSALMHDEKADFIINAVDTLAKNPKAHMDDYIFDASTARYSLGVA